MTQPTKGESQFADRSDNPMISAQGASITAPVAITNFAAADISATYVEAEVQAVADGVDTLEDEVTLLRLAVVALIERLEAHGLFADN